MTNTVFLNDTYLDATQASLLISDLSILRGYGIFDFFKTINDRPVFLQDHLERFFNSAARMHLQVKYTAAELEEIINKLIKINNLPDSGIRLTLTGGYSADGYHLPVSPNLIITQHPLNIPSALDSKGMSLVTYAYQRQLAEMKTLDYSMAIWLKSFIDENKADDVLYHADGLVKECPRANFFIVTPEQEVITAKNGILSGVIRKNILNLKYTGFQLTERDFTLTELNQASEAFITSTTKNILPVLKIDGKNVGNGEAGPVTRKLSELLLEKIKSV
ncbi:aminotransferase class IV [Pedobacter cryoconitis]|uniref:branched-chain-amino-acid transaminase n=1 Tax=Pedobacter cryoconitis TaxID=188932 RepID=A0A7X0J600_9SPHI|nr:aminotransferase class IV [Pedobacter cryoconitis]MBB6501715.1 D-alanine transaminase/branched-chain amino acid aminotransferase [Pedobacter cryoconitis]